jgi:ATP-binding cassette, subfamily B, bacterial HlyB/CyaB
LTDALTLPAEAQRSGGDTQNTSQLLSGNLDLLRIYAQLQGLSLDKDQLMHQLNSQNEKLDTSFLVRSLQLVGFETKLLGSDDKALQSAALPAIVCCQDQRWMIVGGIQDQHVIVQLAGQTTPQKITRAHYKQLASGALIQAKRVIGTGAGSNDADMTPSKFGIAWFMQSLSKYKSLLSEILLASFFVQIFALVTPLIFQVVIDKVLTNRALSTLDVMVIALLGVSLFEIVLTGLRHYLFSHTTNRMDVELGSKLFRHLLHLPLNYFESRRSGDTVARVRELDNVRNFMTGQALTSWLDLFFAIVFLAVMFYYSTTLTLIVIASLPVFFLASWIITPMLRKSLEDKFVLGAENQAYLVETVTAMETLKSQAVEPQWQREWERKLADYVNASFQSGHLANATNQFIGLASKILTVALLYFGAKLVIDGELTVGGLIAFNMLSGRVNAPILKLASLWQDFTQTKVSVKRLADIMDAPAEPSFRPDRSSPPAIEGTVTFDHVTFRYNPTGQEVLTDVSFTAKPGEIIGIVGVSGAGKTTLMRLLQRLYTPERGRLLIDGIDLNLVDTSWLRRQIGTVGQDTLLFNRSVRENIALSDASLSMEQITEAAKLSGAHDFILQLPDGYDTLIGERGSRLSGGQRARIAIARALVINPKLLLLDEATASLDYESERVIHDHMQTICRGRTVFIVAHRLSTLRLASRILVLDQGRLIEQGKHHELINQQGKYASLYHAHQVLETQK